MVDSLPHNIQLRLEQTLAQWRSWQCTPALTQQPAPVRKLGGGLSNYSILVAGEQRFVIRIDGLNPALIGLSRQAEWRALNFASTAGLAPAPRYYNPELGSLVYDYIAADPLQRKDITATAQLLQKIHQLPAVHFRLDLSERLLRYEKHIEHRGRLPHPLLASCRDPVLTLIDELKTKQHKNVLCHNDLLDANRLWSGGTLRAIDWEYCAMSSPWFELAVISVGDEFNSAETEQLLADYLNRTARHDERLVFAQYQSVYRYLALLWFAALDDADTRAQYLSNARLAALQRDLKQ